MEKILKDDILTLLTECNSLVSLRKKWIYKFQYFGINEDKMKDIFITGALFGLITKQAMDFYNDQIPSDVLNEIDAMVIDFIANKFS
ncbi:MAG: hypothetical protein IIC67_01620 [Thaumarchaeota archaeon]|nr:hypothetical protein [Nitrososphaerota archaeon]